MSKSKVEFRMIRGGYLKDKYNNDIVDGDRNYCIEITIGRYVTTSAVFRGTDIKINQVEEETREILFAPSNKSTNGKVPKGNPDKIPDVKDSSAGTASLF